MFIYTTIIIDILTTDIPVYITFIIIQLIFIYLRKSYHGQGKIFAKYCVKAYRCSNHLFSEHGNFFINNVIDFQCYYFETR